MTDIALLGIKVDSSPATKAAKELDILAVSAGRADVASEKLATTSGRKMAPAMSAGGHQSRMMAQQLSQVAQQASATGNWVQALAIQLPDMALGFGAVGIAAGVLAGVTLPLLAAMFGSNSDEAKEAAEAADRLKDAWGALAESGRTAQAEIDKLRFGVDEAYQVELLREQIRLYGEYTAKTTELQSYLNSTTESLDLQRIKTAELRDEIAKIADAYRGNEASMAKQQDRAATLAVIEGVRVQRANEIKAKQDEVAAATKKVEQSLLAAGISAETLASFNFANIAEAAAFAQNLATAMQSASAYSAELAQTGQSSGPDGARSKVQFGGGAFRAPVFGAALPAQRDVGGGGGGADPYATDLQALIENLASERSIEDEWYQENLAILQDRRAVEIMGKEAHDAAMVSLHEEYQRRIAEIDAAAQQQRLGDTANLFGALASIAQAGGQRMAKTAATFGAIEATINAYKAATAALAAPNLTLAGRFAAYASVLGAGLKGVAAIRAAGGIGGGSGGGSSGIAAQGATAPAGQNIEYRVYGLERDAVYSGAFIEKIFAGLMEEGKRRGLNTQTVQFV